jgi:cytochrome c oxidase subunit II
VTSSRDLYADLERIYLPIAAAVVVIFLAVVLFAALRYRRRGDELPSQKATSRTEYAYIGVLVAVAAFLIAVTFHYEDRTDATAAADPGLRIEVTAARWNWRFTYPEQGITVADDRLPTLVVPTDTQVAFTGTSEDVIHSFWVPAMRFKRDIFPDAVTSWHLTFTRAQSEISGECGEYCGLLHGEMRFVVNAVPPAEFRAWVREQQRRGGSGA